jgi:hypothetical protein
LIGQLDPEVKFHSIGILSEDFGEIVTPLPVEENQNGRTLFTLREGSRYQLKLQFSVMHNLVSGLTYLNTVWKGGLQGTHLLLFFLSLLLVKLVYIGFLWLTCYKNIIILKVEGQVQKTITIKLTLYIMIDTHLADQCLFILLQVMYASMINICFYKELYLIYVGFCFIFFSAINLL